MVAIGACRHIAKAVFGRDGDRLVAAGAGRDRRAGGLITSLLARCRADGDRVRAKERTPPLKSVAVIVCVPAVSNGRSYHRGRAAGEGEGQDLLYVMESPGSLSVTVSAKPVTMLFALSSATIVKASGVPAVGFEFETFSTRCVAVAAVTVTCIARCRYCSGASVTVIVCGPLVNSCLAEGADRRLRRTSPSRRCPNPAVCPALGIAAGDGVCVPL